MSIILPAPLTASTSFVAQSWHLGESIELNAKSKAKTHAAYVIHALEKGLAIVFRLGVVVFFNITPSDQRAFNEALKDKIYLPYDEPEMEMLNIEIGSSETDCMKGNSIVLKALTLNRLIVIADVIAKSEVLDFYENTISHTFSSILPLTQSLMTAGKPSTKSKELLKSIGATLAMEYEMVAKAEVIDRPEILWDNNELDTLYDVLCDEFELKERYAILEKKSSLNSRTAQTALDVLSHEHSSRLEWYIIFLIMIEIVLEILLIYFT